MFSTRHWMAIGFRFGISALALGAVTIGLVNALTPKIVATPIGASFTIEAEQAQLSGRFVVAEDSTASGGQYVHADPTLRNNKTFTPEDVALFCFEVFEAGDYSFYGDVRGINGASNSFYVRIDYFDYWTWKFRPSAAYANLPVTYRNKRVDTYLEPGQHVVAFFMRGSGARLDAIDVIGPIGKPAGPCNGPSSDDAPVAGDLLPSSALATGPVPPPIETSTPPTATSPTTTTITTSETSTPPTSITTTTIAAATTAPPPPATTTTIGPPPPPPGTVLWFANYETGDDSAWDQINISGDAESTIVTSPVHSGQYANALTIRDADGNGAKPGVRMTYKNKINIPQQGVVENIPREAYYSAWYYIPHEITVTWLNTHQWKQQYEGSARFLYSASLFNNSDGDLAFSLSSRVDANGNWATGSNRFWHNRSAVAPIGRWFHLESYYKWDYDGNGRIITWLDGDQIWDVGGLTTAFHWPFRTFSRQWIVSNYARETTPKTFTIFVDDVVVSTSRRGPG